MAKTPQLPKRKERSIAFDEEMLDQLEQIARDGDMSVSAIVRRIVREALAGGKRKTA